jgi:hypothetical protein
VLQSRQDLRDRLHRLRCKLSRPSFLVPAAAVGALLAFVLTRRGRMGAVALTLATALIRPALKQLLAKADSSSR